MARRLPPLNTLRAFEAAARLGGFTHAARELNVTPAAVSHQVKVLEDFVGQRLFRRLARGLVLSEVGRAYADGLGQGLDRLAQAQGVLYERRPKGLLRITALPSFAHAWLSHRLPEFLDRYPEVSVELFLEYTATDFSAGDRDVGIRYGLGNYPGLRTTHILNDEVFPVCSPALLNGPTPLRTPRDLLNHTLIHDCATRLEEEIQTWTPWLRRYGLEDEHPPRRLGFSDSTAVLRCAVGGYGVALGRTSLVAEYMAQGRLVRPFKDVLPTDFTYYLVAPEATADEPRIAAFRAWLLDVARAEHDTITGM